MKKRIIGVFLTAMMLISVTGCGGQNTGSADTSGATTESNTESEVPAEKTDLTIVLDWAPNTNHTGLYVAQDKGYFSDAGLNVTIVQPPEDGAATMVASGDAQFGVEFQDTMAPALSQENPLPISAIAAILQHNTSGLVSLKETGIDSFGKLPGHSYATWDSPTEQAILKTLVEKDGGDWSQVKLISTYVEDIVAGLNADIESVWIYAGWERIKLEMENIDHNFLLFKDYDPVFDYYNPVIIGNNDYMKQNPEVVKTFLEAVKKGYEFAADAPEEAADVLLKNAPELDETLVKKSQAYLSTQYIADAGGWGVIDPKRWNSFYQWLNENNLVEKELPENAGLAENHL